MNDWSSPLDFCRGLYRRIGLFNSWSDRKLSIHGRRIYGQWEQSFNHVIPEMRILNLLLKSDDCVFDVGAHIGEFIFYLSKIVTKGVLHAFEPQRRPYNILRGVCCNIRNSHTYNLGLSSSSGMATLFVPIVNGRESDSEASLDPHFNDFTDWERRPKSSKSLQDPILLTTIDEFCRTMAIEKLDFLKIDVEGHELDVLKGGKRTCFRKCRPVLLIEVFPYVYPGHFEEVCQYLNLNDYAGFVISTDDCTGLEPLTLQNVRNSPGYNYWFMPTERVAGILDCISS